MKNLTLNLDLPDTINLLELKLAIASELYKRNLIGTKEVIEQFGIDRKTFIENAGKYGVEIISETPEDLRQLARSLKNLNRES